MCGIVGFTGKKNLTKLDSMLCQIEHRGRDERIAYYKNHVHLGMNRLAVVDLTSGLYPVFYKHYTLVFNGEIYNFGTLKQSLKKLGVTFKTNSDAEVILPLFDAYGTHAFALLEGMFAISIFDAKKDVLILSRDKSGEKPLYYATVADEFVFASELKVILQCMPNAFLHASVLPQYIRHGFVTSPDTLVCGVQKVPPSGFISLDIKKKSLTRVTYWKPGGIHISETRFPGEKGYISHLDSLVQQSVSARLLADVPVGCFLSGGVDSSLIAWFASLENRALRTYSVVFPGHEHEDESAYSRFVATKLKSNHTEVVCTAKSVIPLLEHIAQLIDEPIVDPAVLPTMLMAKEARKKVTVALTGEGADELFGGYSRYQKELFIHTLNRVVPQRLNTTQFPITLFPNRLKTFLTPLPERYSAQHVWNNREISGLLRRNPQEHPNKYLLELGTTNPLLSMQLADYRGYMAEQLLMKIDKSTMAYNLEARAPYLSSEIISFSLGLSTAYKIRNFRGKYILKKVAERYFPNEFVHRKKHGFDIPLGDWFRGELRPFVDTSVVQMQRYTRIFNCEEYAKVVKSHMDGTKNNSGKIWSIVVLLRWMEAHNIQQ